jgi:2'-5' RNA ligase
VNHPPFILTLKLDEVSFKTFNALRQVYFPPLRNFIPAHLTLFHALPGEAEQRLCEDLGEICAQTAALQISFPGVRFLGRGVAIEAESPGLIELRNKLAKGWSGLLVPQDRQGYRPHVTIQNKVEVEEARQLFGKLSEEWQPIAGSGDGLLLWRYRGGPWEFAKEFWFGE